MELLAKFYESKNKLKWARKYKFINKLVIFYVQGPIEWQKSLSKKLFYNENNNDDGENGESLSHGPVDKSGSKLKVIDMRSKRKLRLAIKRGRNPS